MLGSLARFVVRRRVAVLVASLLAMIVAGVVGGGVAKHLSGGGFDYSEIDAGAALQGGVMEQRYTLYDAIGRVREDGETSRFAKHFYYDAGDDVYRLSAYAHRDNPTSQWITTSIESHVVDGETVVDALVEATRTTKFTTVGRFVTQKTLTPT